MKNSIIILILFLASAAYGKDPASDYYELRIYRITDAMHGSRLEHYLEKALLPALHRAGIPTVGVFKPIASDTLNARRIYVLITYHSLEQFEKTPAALLLDKQYLIDGREHLEAGHDDPTYTRMETFLMKAFKNMTTIQAPKLKSPRDQRIYELRSYEAATEKLYRLKVHMFNEGNEIGLFKRLNFNAVFYGDVLTGSKTPNLMYMTAFENKEDRDAHWKTFVDDPEWKTLSARPEYQHTVSKAEIFLLNAAPYSDL